MSQSENAMLFFIVIQKPIIVAKKPSSNDKNEHCCIAAWQSFHQGTGLLRIEDFVSKALLHKMLTAYFSFVLKNNNFFDALFLEFPKGTISIMKKL